LNAYSFFTKNIAVGADNVGVVWKHTYRVQFSESMYTVKHLHWTPVFYKSFCQSYLIALQLVYKVAILIVMSYMAFRPVYIAWPVVETV